MPALGRENQLRAPERKKIEHPGELISPRLEIFRDAGEAANRCRWRDSLTLQLALYSQQPGGGKLCILQQREHFRQELQIFRSFLRRVSRLLKRSMQQEVVAA